MDQEADVMERVINFSPGPAKLPEEVMYNDVYFIN